MSRPKVVIVGTGALGLGFLAERLVPDYDVCLADVSAQESRLRRLVAEKGFVLNVCAADKVTIRHVAGSFTCAVTDTREGSVGLAQALHEADIILTATNRQVLDHVVEAIAPALNARSRPAWLLFCENGLDIAQAYRPAFGPHVGLADTVMSRMCRFGTSQDGRYVSTWPDGEECLVVEDYDYLPVDGDGCRGGPFSSAFALLPHADFLLWEDVKLYMHNGMHAFVAYRNFLAGVERFSDTPAAIREAARTVMLTEVVPAIAHTHPCGDRDWLVQYGLELLARFTNPFFDDSVERGVRGVQAKLAPGERIVGGCEYIKQAGIEPRGYAGTIQAGVEILARRGLAA